MALPFLLLNNEGLSFPVEILKGTEDKKKRREFAVLGIEALVRCSSQTELIWKAITQRFEKPMIKEGDIATSRETAKQKGEGVVCMCVGWPIQLFKKPPWEKAVGGCNQKKKKKEPDFPSSSPFLQAG